MMLTLSGLGPGLPNGLAEADGLDFDADGAAVSANGLFSS